ncbi:MAG: septal ring lytic transglycosylase RlpA family protein [Betaproteobacteria bacterium]
MSLHPFEPEFRSGLSFRVAQGTPQGRRTWGRLSLLTFFGEAKKVSCRRATPGLITIAIALTLTACGTTPKKTDPSKPSQASTSKPGAYYLDDGPGDGPLPNLDKIPNAVPKPEKLHSGANRTYTVFGKTYVPNVSSAPFRQQGIGSWYGRKFHGQKTSIGETYDMYAMTAAHPTLPLPCYVRVSNPANGKSVVVRVNDRGPFHSDRIIDLSYVAAAKLDYARRGSALVIVERVFPGDLSDKLPPVATIAPPPSVPMTMPVPTAVTASPVIPERGVLYLQLGAFGSLETAEGFRARMMRELDWNREPLQLSRKDNLFRVRMGPYNSREEADAIAAQVRLSLDISPVIQQP